MKGCRCILIMALFVFTIMSYGQKEFKLSNNVPIDSLALQMSFNETSVCRPFLRSGAITGLAVSGKFQKTSPEYLVRIILKDTKGFEHLVLESYEEINSCDTVCFWSYCEETALLDYVMPDSLKIILKDATLQLDNLLTTKSINREVTSIESKRKVISKAQTSNKIERINEYNKLHKRLWVAGETSLSQMDYTSRKCVLGISDDESSGGIEHYVGGIFEWGHSDSLPQTRISDGYVEHWDWRNVQGTNWITSVKNQGNANYCTPFAVVACLEAMVNLYYNRKIDLDLSEMEIVCCADSYPHLPDSTGLSTLTAMEYAVQNGVCDESSYPYVITNTPTCQSDNISKEENVAPCGIKNFYSNAKNSLIKNGPLVVSKKNGIFGPGHAMLLIGYGILHENDSVSYLYDFQDDDYFYTSLESGDYRIGKTYWILKNSWGTNSFWNTDGGYIYILDHIGNMFDISSTFQLPLTTINYSENDIIIEDFDGDGYYNWGLGPKPASCPVWIPDTPDGDDSDPTKHLMDYYGNYPETYSFPMGTEYLNTNRTISGNESLMKDIDISHGTTLTITGSAYCLENVKINNYGGTLIIDGGVLANADIVLHSPCTFIIRNGGTVYMKKNKNLVIPVGCVSDIEGGEIRGPFERK